ncbi:MAG: prephenate dehydrogenase/arogenate dehydrogenase family protein [Victivallaceae bacterium]|nr:prephenate dehydrogenase/arogenate dehydrogenase family protein [Victivallaceae bacterium]
MNCEIPKNIAIIGLGLLGTSLGMALRGHSEWRRLGWTRRACIRRWAVDCDVIDETGDDPAEIIHKADLTFIAMPVPAIIDFLRRHADDWQPGAVVTDLGSVKRPVVEAAACLATRGVSFVGGHPMAGTEKSGPESAFPELYRNADVFIVPGDNNQAADSVAAVWQSLGCNVVRINAQRHDDLVAHTSHVLHILASALTLSILDAPDEETKLERFAGCATGFRDTSRIASSNPVMWREIIESNRDAVMTAMRDFEVRYNQMKKSIESGDFDGFEKEFAAGKLLRDGWLEYKQGNGK